MLANNKAKTKDSAQAPPIDKKTGPDTKKHEPIQYKRITCAELDAGDYKLEYLIAAYTCGWTAVHCGWRQKVP